MVKIKSQVKKAYITTRQRMLNSVNTDTIVKQVSIEYDLTYKDTLILKRMIQDKLKEKRYPMNLNELKQALNEVNEKLMYLNLSPNSTNLKLQLDLLLLRSTIKDSIIYILEQESYKKAS